MTVTRYIFDIIRIALDEAYNSHKDRSVCFSIGMLSSPWRDEPLEFGINLISRGVEPTEITDRILKKMQKAVEVCKALNDAKIKVCQDSVKVDVDVLYDDGQSERARGMDEARVSELRRAFLTKNAEQIKRMIEGLDEEARDLNFPL